MAAVSVTFDGTRINDAEALGTVWEDWTGTATTVENDFKYQATNCIAELVKTTEHGVKYYDSVTSYDYTSPVRVGIFKTIVTNYAVSNVKGSTGMKICIGSADTNNYYTYYIAGSDTYPIRGGWLITPIDPNIAAYRDATVGTPVLTAVNFYAWIGTMTATAKSANFGFDAIDFVPHGGGLTLVSGDGADADGTFTHFITSDEGTATNRWGVVSTLEGILYIVGVLTIGTATATVFTDSLKTLVFPSGRFNTGFCGVDLGLQNASTVISITSCTFIGRGTSGTNDTRPDIGITGTSGTATIDGCTFVNFNDIVLTSGVTLSDSKFVQCDSLTQANAIISGCIFDSSPVAAGTAFMTAVDLADISTCSFISGGTGHAIEITAIGTYTFANNTFTGYGADTTDNAAIYNNSGGLVTIQVTGGVALPTYKNGAGATTSVTAASTLTVTVVDEDNIAIEGAQVLINKLTPIIYTSDTGNNAGNGNLIVNEAIDTDLPQSGTITVWDKSANKLMNYRYSSWVSATKTFTFNTEVTGTANTGGSSTTLKRKTGTSFLIADIQEGDTVRNTTDGSWGIVDEIVDADTITLFEPLTGGSDNTWQENDAYSFHKLAVTLIDNDDIVRVPIMNTQTNASGIATRSYTGANVSIRIDVRKSSEATKYQQYSSPSAISGGLTTTVVLIEDTVA